jgi:GH35 family endo-1,4-beta-xylanase
MKNKLIKMIFIIMKLKNIIPVTLVVITFGLNACYDEKMEWGDSYTHPEEKDLPLELQEKISRYEALNTYTNFTLGVGIDFSLYINDETYRNIVNQNFDEITPGNEMKQSSLMDNNGNLNFSNADLVITALKEAGLTIYGHTLVWHNQQQAVYLNNLIKPTIIPGTPGESLIVNGSFETGLDGWTIPNYAEAVTRSDDFSSDGTYSMKVAVGDWAGDKYNMQIKSPTFQITEGHRYEISFFIKSDIAGGVGLDFDGNATLGEPYPSVDGIAVVPTSSAWSKVTYNPTTVGGTGMTATADGEIYFRLLLGAVKNCTYYIDAVEVIDLDAEPSFSTLFSNGDFEEGKIDPWFGWSGNSAREISEKGEGYAGDYAMKLTNEQARSIYEVQVAYDNPPLSEGKTYKVTAYVRCENGNGKIQMEAQNTSNYDDGQYSGTKDVGTSWSQIEWEFTALANRNRFTFDYGETVDVYYVDNISLQEVAASSESSALRSGPVIIEKSDEEKAEIIGAAMKSWISEIVGHYKENVRAWDVVNEPMNDSGNGLKTGIGKTLNANEFYWQDYLGKDYAVKAFKWAREAAGENTKLFINDYGLESESGVKLDRLLEYVAYIEQEGGKVDGIGTQMHLNINWNDSTAIERMFQKLGASGKLIKISELDIAIANSSDPESPVSPAAEQYAKQAGMYQYVVDMYMKHIPEAQRYGITVWSVSDNEKEHQYWLKNDAPCLWNADYARKHAYKGFADGLAGKDVSADFSGNLIY